ncbi:pseudouridine synthase [Massarina eburnea CBS 473.64]|uniref:tRNA pseudouridine(55) synthase n=1 Tax=Massarina eburnea CBS 473.64 TaxID=1395130 RepID=A0A6A6SJJ5_9PLEO|nr:pseudouridine synthase [Massarina eburnea CBS 473.64]
MAASTPKETRKVLEGIFAINKPQWASSAGVLRDLQTPFSTSPLFTPWLDYTRRNLILGGAKEKHQRNLKVKMGHGGTLDPLATGVLIVGVGKGTKLLPRFLECLKTYECVVLFGAATDSYDAVGKVVSRAEYAHVTRELVESKLENFRGKIMQKPSVFSALKVDGKKMYEYARAGGDIPEVAARPVEVQDLKLVEWLEPGAHEFAWPKEEVDTTEKVGAERLLGIRKVDADASRSNRKRSRTPEKSADSESKKPRTDSEQDTEDAPKTEVMDDHVTNAEDHPKPPSSDDEPAMSGALPAEDIPVAEASKPTQPQPPAVRLRMTVSSGFYVRSLCHDLGVACSSLGLMSSLIRTRQGDYELGRNVLDYSDLEAGPEKWEHQVQKLLEQSMRYEGWEAEEVEDEETWLEKKKELDAQRKENDRDRSYQGGGGGGKKKWSGKGGKYRNY